MKASFEINNPDNIEATIKLSMTIGEWKRLSSQLEGNYPSWKLGEAIRSVVREATQVFDAKDVDAFG